MFGKSKKMTKLVTRECSSLTKQIINHLISNNIHIKTHDTLYIFQQSFCFTVWVVRHNIGSGEQFLNMRTDVLWSLKDWLNDSLFNKSDGEYEDEIVKVLADLNGEYITNWVLEIVADNPNIKDYSLHKKIAAYYSKYISSVNDYICEIYDDTPIDFVEYLGSIAQQSVNILV